jgi:hypothetical protein
LTVRLKEAFEKAARLPDELQNELADELIADINNLPDPNDFERKAPIQECRPSASPVPIPGTKEE